MRINVKIIFAGIGLATGSALFVPGTTRAAAGILCDQKQVLAEFFPDADTVQSADVQVTPELAAKLKSRLGYVPALPVYRVFVGRKDGRVLGYAVIDDEKGMHEPITFAVLIGTNGAVKAQKVMVYREPEGDGITREKFSRQFVGKTIKDPIRAHQDIIVVSSATISSESMAIGVRRALAVVDEGILNAPTLSSASLDVPGKVPAAPRSGSGG